MAAAWRRDSEQADLWEECHRLEHLLALNARATSHLDIAEVLAVAREAAAAVGGTPQPGADPGRIWWSPPAIRR